ncbi:hypothetical protein [Ruminococcus champanellensis]|uniref:hypothetical protein n=1 Tax=Ruminococcus champanellensis TaxID=1161942 RepID=UPI002E791EF3|nr:hypothetical protein [Ruminococcus champanellensis]MED9891720.1 hypothetical protein [Ruminococcus champanellensis]
MSKLFPLLTCGALLLALTGCNQSDSSQSNSAATSTVDSNAVSPERQATDYDSLVKAFTPLLDQYYEGLRTQSFDTAFNVFPSFYVDQIKKECQKEGITTDQYVQQAHTYFSDKYGADYTVTYTINQIFQLTDDSLASYNDIIHEKFDDGVQITDAYSVKITETDDGSAGSETCDLEWYVFVIGGQNYLYESYYETT